MALYENTPLEHARTLLLSTGSVRLKVTPRAKREEIHGLEQDASGAVYLKVHIRAVPEDGKANEAVIALISKQFDIPKSHLRITQGSTSRYKVIACARG